MKELTLEATIENITRATEFVEEQLEAAQCPLRTCHLINIAVDELFSNVARYAYAPGTGMVTVRMEVRPSPPAAEISFIDSGVPYNPLMQEEPDTTAPLKKRRIGGLGIHMVRKSMDEFRYEYKDGQNVSTIVKAF